MSSEKTMLQVYGVPGIPLSSPALPRHTENNSRAFRKFREMRSDPTIALVRGFSIAPIVLAGWSYEATDAAPEGARDFIREMMEPLRLDFCKQALEGCFDFGWAPFEKVWDVDSKGRETLRKLKPLLQAYTEILVDTRTGEYMGLRQRTHLGDIDLNESYSLVVNIDTEGTDWYGRATMRNLELPYDAWFDVENSAKRYDRKIAGSHIMVSYPEGESMYNGAKTDNFIVAQELIKAMQSSGAIAVPIGLRPYEDDSGNEDDRPMFKVELLNDGASQQGSFIERQRYLDILKVRGSGVPERAILEGTQGTKAEASTHGDIGLLILELRHVMLTQAANRKIINHALYLNYGPDAVNTVFASPSQIDDVTKQFLMQLYMAMLQHQESGLLEADHVDTQALRDKLGVPSVSEAELPDPSLMPTDPTIAQDPGPLPGRVPLPDKTPLPERGDNPARKTGPKLKKVDPRKLARV